MSSRELPIAACALDADGVRRQRDRYAEIGATIVATRRKPTALTIELSPAADRALVEETAAIERDCCPFFRIAYDSRRRVLTVEVDRESEAPALDAIAHALTARRRSTP